MLVYNIGGVPFLPPLKCEWRAEMEMDAGCKKCVGTMAGGTSKAGTGM